MNPLWAFFFKDRYRTLFSVYKMSLAEIIFLLAMTAGAGAGIYVGAKKALHYFAEVETVEE
jgi:hypothetical protein